MFEHLRGTLDSKTPAHVVIDVNGVGYGVSVPLSTYERLPATGQPVRLHTWLSVREDAHRLFGFHSLEERALFKALIGVSGVGPMVALAILSSVPPAAFRAAVLAGDAARLRGIRGVGKRLSERLVVELKDVIDDVAATLDGASPVRGLEASAKDATLALEKMGFSASEAAKAILAARDGAPDCDDAGELVRLALRLL